MFDLKNKSVIELEEMRKESYPNAPNLQEKVIKELSLREKSKDTRDTKQFYMALIVSIVTIVGVTQPLWIDPLRSLLKNPQVKKTHDKGRVDAKTNNLVKSKILCKKCHKSSIK